MLHVATQPGDPVAWQMYRTASGWRLSKQDVRHMLEICPAYRARVLASMHSRVEAAFINSVLYPDSADAARVLAGFITHCHELGVEGDATNKTPYQAGFLLTKYPQTIIFFRGRTPHRPRCALHKDGTSQLLCARNGLVPQLCQSLE